MYSKWLQSKSFSLENSKMIWIEQEIGTVKRDLPTKSQNSFFRNSHGVFLPSSIWGQFEVNFFRWNASNYSILEVYSMQLQNEYWLFFKPFSWGFLVHLRSLMGSYLEVFWSRFGIILSYFWAVFIHLFIQLFNPWSLFDAITRWWRWSKLTII